MQTATQSDAERLLLDLSEAYGRERDVPRTQEIMSRIVSCPVRSAHCILTLLDMIQKC